MKSVDPAWTDTNLANPHDVADKAVRVERMFAAIARSYDINNRVHSLWRDQAWRRAAVRLAAVQPGDVVVDVACGTGDLSLAFCGAAASRVVGIDFTYNMLAVAQSKSPASGKSPAYYAGDAMRLPLPDGCADVVSIAFGIRNVADPAAAVREFHRILRPGGRLVVLEFSLPRSSILRGMYNFYFKRIMPHTAAWIARDRSGAYKYLPQSVNTFIGRERLVGMLNDAGFTDVTVHPQTFGIAVIYRGVRSSTRGS